MIVLQWDQHHVIKVVKYLRSCLLLLLQRDSCLCRPNPRRLVYHGLLNFTSSVIFRQFMNNTHFSRHVVCIFNIAVHWYKELCYASSLYQFLLSSTNVYEECSYQTSLAQGHLRHFLAGRLHAKTSWNIQNNLSDYLLQQVFLCTAGNNMYQLTCFI